MSPKPTHPHVFAGDPANALGNIKEDGVEFVIGKHMQKGMLKHVGGKNLL